MSGHVENSLGTAIQLPIMAPITKVHSLSPTSLKNDDNKADASATYQEASITNSQRVFTSLAAGAIAGGVAKTAIAPLDRTKIKFQISKQPFTARAAIDSLVNDYKRDGLVSLWRGNSATMVRIIPYAAIQFTAFEQWKRILKVEEPGREHDHKTRRFLAGALAGITSQSMTYPLDLARAQMAVSQKDEIKNLRHVFIRIYEKEGIASFYRGFTPTILGVIPYAGVSFFFYDTLKNMFSVYTVHNPGLSAMSGLVSGAVAGMMGQATSYPLDIVRRRMQTSTLNNNLNTLGVLQMTKKIYAEDGIRSFYKGLSMNWVKGPIAVGISFATYDLVKDTLRQILC
ncbi:hypothetical protein TSAR_013697 [Trichomalopsis sarcophagae]|uniref:Uncharacterized protein n=1 Tax=Trichomalopsis sarcophagae TaxID=543379 RepID=A0A232F4A3_9HYME|nr:hypothetical protein TSAR_013697 [Trichomalopsis sarcophagae]